MDTRKILVADASLEFCGALSDLLGGAYELRICHDGLEAQSLLESFQPDVLILDLTLPQVDGIAVLKMAVSSIHRPAALVTARFLSPYIERSVEALGVDYLMAKPCDARAVADHVHDMANRGGNLSILRPDRTVTVATMLLNLNISTKRKGFRCLETAISLYEKHPGQSVTKVLYPEVAKQLGCSKDSVERAIRAAIHTAWTRRDEKIWRLYFPTGREGIVSRPTNTAFIATLVECMKRQCRDQMQA